MAHWPLVENPGILGIFKVFEGIFRYFRYFQCFSIHFLGILGIFKEFECIFNIFIETSRKYLTYLENTWKNIENT